jgi:uncharacterized protein YceK
MSKTRRLLMLLPLAVLSASLAGCGTLITLIEGPVDFDNNKIAYPYSGTRFSLGGARKSPVAFIFVIDVPFSLAGDTVVLPIRLVQSLYSRFFGSDEPVEVLEPEAT